MRLYAIILVFVSWMIFISGCSSESENQPDKKKSPSVSDKKVPATDDVKLDDLKQQYERVESYAASNPRQLQTILTQIDGFKAQAGGTQFQKKAEELAAKAQQSFDSDARDTFEKLRDKAREAIDGGRAREALEILGEYPAEFNTTEWQAKIDEMAGPIEKEAEANRKFEIMVETIDAALKDRNPEAALKAVESYPEAMRTGVRKVQWEKHFNELSIVVNDLRSRFEREEHIPWEELFTGDNIDKWSPQSGQWIVEKELMKGSCASEAQGFIYCGDASAIWDDFILELDFNIVRGDFLVLGIRGKNEEGKSVFDQITFDTDRFPPGKFNKVTVEVRADMYTIRPEKSSQVFTQTAEPGYTKGPICFFLVNDSEVHIRSIRIKHLK